MGPKSESNEYEFFENMDKVHIYKAVNLVNNGTFDNSSPENGLFINCNYKSFKDFDKKVCNKFNNLISLICNSKSSLDKNSALNNSDYKYLNFWVNREISSKGSNDNVTIEEFSNNTKDENKQCINKDILSSVLIYIYPNELKRMKILDNLYQHYYEMHEIIFSNTSEKNGECLEFSQKCVAEYKTAITKYGNTKDNFYNALMKYENNYIKLHAEAVRKNTSFEEYIEKIPIEYKISDLSFYSAEYERKKIILISLLGSALAIISILIYFYKFTLLGTRMCARARNKKKKFRSKDDTNNALQCFDDFCHSNSNNKMYDLAYNTV
ncbi:PIR protein [Plasmodium vivax]|uniref:VIR protein n=1 Tax=Plasmodium vivax TaxID=5855 RepID=A0A565A424_PLAVI|nr:PIR protein [Plasmodium vivax]